ncbi:MAG: D-glycero-beta-D-manno-heptose 1-phosphate adenylyltransferase, partial [Deltaproteobacteria bacterium]
DWAEDEIIGSDIVKAAGGRVVRIPYIEGFSTTAIIERILQIAEETGST